MNSHIEDYIRKHNIHIEYSNEVSFPAKKFDTPKGPVIIVNSALREEEQNQAILHELGHNFYDKEVAGSYTDDDNVHSKMESNANKYMLQVTLNQYRAETDIDPHDINSIDFLEHHNLNLNLDSIT
ncbi:ImmA/IrrE family metallo-endopeptidase [Limosilactobacillus reuteri]|uniref:ImmA/IrrE family metallo-endopeptidase n=1 Tax=Limosilactobacillus reuteri TaxID=1598 RepID=UPI003F251EAB